MVEVLDIASEIAAENEPVTVPSIDPSICLLCNRHFAKYTCPRCAIPYCSLACYKGERHAECSEDFYKTSLIEEIKNKKVDDEQKRSMLDVLKRFEEDQGVADEELQEILREEGDGEGLEDEEESDNTDLKLRLEGLDLDEASFEEMWQRLTPEERERFVQIAREAEEQGVDLDDSEPE
ncbi:hypothetical protein SAICODRAFT_32102 [Saitoella complicata NRRL Y-17804]|uniref:HIT-type domain-containing protein n=1 Tax=Saitoella complicata (strain BCRC 22490 / CBS 7301 / JCM 7358 / NBRC 10748 / NRRL Y-17804) TaxID=698492 RepID=A0A0E9NJR2_SAICN|nr:uncharacterized protein SAICODRAFT_32102 [Saitoella complicata NRRL Y-17804]ODQ50143.1 hypothetical protein SAICODRAFT_32102 [Saitoella complicata NRRL Y-17804]GAO49916.1 hypothetical protein G7K_4052-t1 [Saitoella complicata NRRL Y-17804]